MSSNPERRRHDFLRKMVDEACKGVMPQISDRIKNVARRAYYLGVADGIKLEKEARHVAS